MFVGRESELKTLEKCRRQKKSMFIVCSGRRRIGKSRLIQQWGKSFTAFYEFQGLHPLAGRTERAQLAHFANRLKIYFKRPQMTFNSWIEAFSELDRLLPKRQTLIFFDEISWMGHGSETFTGELKDAWDTIFKKHPHLVLVAAGSVSSWIEKNILQNSNFLGRVSLQMVLDELPLQVIAEFWGQQKNLVSAYDVCKTAAIFGGIPLYLESINPMESPDQNIKRLCFDPSGYLVSEYEKIFSDIFTRRSEIYKRIVLSLSESPANLTQLAKRMKVGKSGSLSKYLEDLVKSGFLSADLTYQFSGEVSKHLKYRLKDNYLRFALKYIEPNKSKILEGMYQFSSIQKLPAWNTIVGFQFENLILNNKKAILEKLDLAHEDIISCSPYIQTQTSKNKGGCQIDLLIVTRFHQLYVCEIKFKVSQGSQVLNEVKQKIHLLKRPKHFSVIPVLIYAGDLANNIIASNYFKLISIDELVW